MNFFKNSASRVYWSVGLANFAALSAKNFRRWLGDWLNNHSIRKGMTHVAVCGNIGSGKTTLTTLLAKHYNWNPLFEQVEDNPYLEDFYKDMKQWSFHLQVFFLNSRFRQISEIQKGEHSVIQDRTIYEDAHIFARNLYESGLMPEREYRNYRGLYETVLEFAPAPDLLIYLQADLPKLVRQISMRGKAYERSMQLDYLTNLNRAYEDWISTYDHGKLLIINVNEMDFLHNREDFSSIIERIDGELFGLFS